MSKTRKVVVYEWQQEKSKPFEMRRVCIGSGIFHQFGVNYEEFETGLGNFSTAIVEMPDGSVRNIPVNLIIFNN